MTRRKTLQGSITRTFLSCLAAFAKALPLSLLAFFLLMQSARGAELNWQALPDRERVTISLKEMEGVAGEVARIAPTAILIPFTRVPPELVALTSPEGAKIFKQSTAEGRALALHTQSPEFGFMVTRPDRNELVIDFFHNPLGARWKPSRHAPVTEVQPDEGLQETTPPDAVAKALDKEPEGKGPLSQEAVQEQASPSPSSSPPPGAAPEQSRQKAGEESPPKQQEAAQNKGPENQRPPVVSLSGSPIHAAEVTAQAPPSDLPAGPPARGMLENVGSVNKQNGKESGSAKSGGSLVSMPILDVRTHTAERAAPLPLPEPPLSLPLPVRPESGQTGAPPSEAPPAAIQAQQTAPAAPVTAAPAAPGARPAVPNKLPSATPQHSAEVKPADGLPSSQTQQVTPPQTREGQRAPDFEAETPGRAWRVGPTLYRGHISVRGFDAANDSGQTGKAPRVDSARQSALPEESLETISLPDQSPPPPGQAGPASGLAAGRPEEPDAPITSEALAPDAAGVSAKAPQNAPVSSQDEQQPTEPSLAQLINAMRETVAKGDFPAALALSESLLARDDLGKDEREELLHVKAEMLFAVHKDSFDGYYTPISDAATQAINFNPRSRRNAAALLRLGYMNLKMNNAPEADANFNMMRRNFPDDENVPLSYYYWGEHYFGKNELQKAADEFQTILQKYPNSRYAREAALGLARSFYRLGYYDQAFTIVDYIEKRWERFYLDYPPFLNMTGDVAYRLDKLEDALRHYWLYINLTPEGEEADIILTRIGDIYSSRRETAAANEMYRECLRRFPDKDGGLVAMMRLAERDVNDAPTIAGMFSLFEGPYSLEPLRVYQSIIQDHPLSGLVPLAKIKLAMWHLWKKEFTTALDQVTEFLQKHPEHELAPRAKEIAMQAFAVLALDSVADGNYSRMHEIWERYPVVHSQGEALAPESRIALAVSYWKDGKPNEALDTVAPFFLGKKTPEYSEMALSLVLSIYLDFDQWQAILDVAQKIELWEITPESRLQLDYALALAHENLNHPDQAGPIWQKLYDGDKLAPAQKAYAAFFLARHAEKERELQKAYTLGREALGQLTEQADRSGNASDVNKIKSQLASLMDIAETAGRLREALGFADQYLRYLEADDAERTTVRYRMARIHKKQGDMDSWKKILTDIAAKDPASVYGQIASSELKAAAIAEDAARFSPTGKL